MRQRLTEDSSNPLLEQGAVMLFSLALLLEGSGLPDPGCFTNALTELLRQVF